MFKRCRQTNDKTNTLILTLTLTLTLNHRLIQRQQTTDHSRQKTTETTEVKDKGKQTKTTTHFLWDHHKVVCGLAKLWALLGISLDRRDRQGGHKLQRAKGQGTHKGKKHTRAKDFLSCSPHPKPEKRGNLN